MTDVLAAALAFDADGCCVIPTRGDGTKAPALKWKATQSERPVVGQLQRWFGPGGFAGLGVVCGAVSGNLEMLELEGRAIELGPELAQAMADNGAGDLWARLGTGYLEQSPSGGLHWLYRTWDTDALGNTKLARRPSTPAELDAWKAAERAKADRAIADDHARRVRHEKIDDTTAEQVPQVLIETRGEGGYVVVAPSAGTTHPTGKPWVLLAGSPATIPTISGAERDQIHAICGLLDRMPKKAARDPEHVFPPVTPRPEVSRDGELRPGDDFEARTSWHEILEPHGWTCAGPGDEGRGLEWVRPGKNPRDGISATTGRDPIDRLYVFSSSTDFEPETPYLKFAAHALLNHGGDHAAAAAGLRKAGFGGIRDDGPTLTYGGTPPKTTATSPETAPGATNSPPGSHYTLTDDGNALRLVDVHHEQIRYVPQRGLWLTWSGHRWAWDEAELVRELARGIARDLPANSDRASRHRVKSLSNASITAAVRLARTDPRIVTHIAALDAHPFQLNTPGGVVDLTTGTLSTPDPAQLHTRSTNVAPDFEAPAPRWGRFLADTFAGDPELTTYVQRLIGVSLIGEVLEQILPFAYGSGANGKTTLLGAIQRIVGFGDTGYAISAPTDLLLATRNNDHPASIAQLTGARLVVTSELEDGQQFAEARVKQLTGRDAINARFMHQNPFTFVPSHTFWMLANHAPQVKAGGPAFWRRIAMLPFLHTVPLDDRDPHLEDRLVDDEGAAVLAWAIRGAADYLQHGLALPASVKTATEAYQLDQDTVTRFVADRCKLGPISHPDFRVKKPIVRADYESWCRDEGEDPVNPKAFTLALRSQHNVDDVKSNGIRYYLGMQIVDAPDIPRRPDPETLRWDQT